jgi:hypothetical protein
MEDLSILSTTEQSVINFVNNRAVRWKSRLQSIVTLSSCEAEYVALCSEVCEVKYLRSLMRELGHRQVESTLWEDNKAANSHR